VQRKSYAGMVSGDLSCLTSGVPYAQGTRGIILRPADGRQAEADILARMTPPSILHPDGDGSADRRRDARRAGVSRIVPTLVLAVVVAASLLILVPATAGAATVAQLKDQLAAITAEAAPAAAAYDAASTDLENTQYRIKVTDSRIKTQTKRLATSEAQLASRADAMYREGADNSMLSFILGATSWDDFVTRLDYITIIASSDAALVDQVKVTRAGLVTDRARLVSDAAVQTKEVAVLKARQDAMDAKLASKRAEYNRLLGQIAAQMAKEHPGKGSYPAGPNGMVFPVRGIHAYSDTWGAPRSGGRHHMGTDIMSPRGTPVVAVSSGSARPHFNSLGGNSITLTGSNGWTYYYAHLDHYAIKGGHVSAGQVIGYVGNTGNAAGGPCHLHFQMGPHGNWVDPYRYLRAME
jgi:murein DD-endopeptidase MepM/ murein hydrolase activator NlpD